MEVFTGPFLTATSRNMSDSPEFTWNIAGQKK